MPSWLVLAMLWTGTDAAASELFAVGEPEWLAGGGIGDRGPALAASLLPRDVACAPDGRLFIADEQHNLVRVVTPDGTIATAVGSGVFGPGDDTVPATRAALQVPVSLQWTPDGRLLFVDMGNRMVRALEPDGSVVSVLTEDDPKLAAAPNRFGPADIALGPDGSLYVADRGSHSVWRLGPDHTLRRVAGTGESGFDGDDPLPATSARLYRPRAVAVDARRVLYIADTGNGRVRRVDLDGLLYTDAGTAAR